MRLVRIESVDTVECMIIGVGERCVLCIAGGVWGFGVYEYIELVIRYL